MTGTGPGTYVLLALICWCLGGLLLLAAGALALNTAIRNHRRSRPMTELNYEDHYEPATEEELRAATARDKAALAPLEAKARELRAQLDAKHRAEVLREAADAVDSGKTAFPEPVRSGASWAARMLRRMADEAQQ